MGNYRRRVRQLRLNANQNSRQRGEGQKSLYLQRIMKQQIIALFDLRLAPHSATATYRCWGPAYSVQGVDCLGGVMPIRGSATFIGYQRIRSLISECGN